MLSFLVHQVFQTLYSCFPEQTRATIERRGIDVDWYLKVQGDLCDGWEEVWNIASGRVVEPLIIRIHKDRFYLLMDTGCSPL
jgi:hypothetical protein